MPVPKRKRSKARRDKRFANKGLKVQAFTSCAQCKAALAPHQACKSWGFYKGAKVLETKVERGLKRAETHQVRSAKAAKEAPIDTKSEE